MIETQHYYEQFMKLVIQFEIHFETIIMKQKRLTGQPKQTLLKFDFSFTVQNKTYLYVSNIFLFFRKTIKNLAYHIAFKTYTKDMIAS